MKTQDTATLTHSVSSTEIKDAFFKSNTINFHFIPIQTGRFWAEKAGGGGGQSLPIYNFRKAHDKVVEFARNYFFQLTRTLLSAFSLACLDTR